MNAGSLLTRLRRPEGRRFLAFLLTGGFAAACNITSRIGFDKTIRGLGYEAMTAYEIAVVLSYLIGMTVAFTLARLFVFQTAGRGLHVEYGRFAVVNVVALAQVWLVSVTLHRWVFPFVGLIWHADTIAHVIGVLSPVVVSYQGHKRFSFG